MTEFEELKQPERKSFGFIYLARRACGKVSAACWDDAMSKDDVAECVAEYIKRGDTVERVERFEGDPQPDWICRLGCNDCVGSKRLESKAVYSAAGFDAAREEIARLKAGAIEDLRLRTELMEQYNQLKAENAQLKNQEIELKAEVEALRKSLKPLLAHWDDLDPGESVYVEAARAALSKGEQS